MSGIELIAMPVLGSLAAFGLILTSKLKRKAIWLTAACICPSLPYLAPAFLDMSAPGNIWALFLSLIILALSVVGNIALMIIVLSVRGHRRE